MKKFVMTPFHLHGNHLGTPAISVSIDGHSLHLVIVPLTGMYTALLLFDPQKQFMFDSINSFLFHAFSFYFMPGYDMRENRICNLQKFLNHLDELKSCFWGSNKYIIQII